MKILNKQIDNHIETHINIILDSQSYIMLDYPLYRELIDLHYEPLYRQFQMELTTSFFTQLKLELNENT